KLFGRPIKIQFRSGSTHTSQDASVSHPQYERTVNNMTPSSQMVQRSCSTPENYQRQAVMNNVLRQISYGGKFGSLHVDQLGFSPSVQSHNQNYNQSSSSQWRQNTLASQRKVRQNSHPYLADRHYSREQRYSDHGSVYHYRGGRDNFFYEDRNHDGWNHNYDNRRDSSRDGNWHSSRH
uniref:RNA-binding protein 7 n=1 Tax=Nannospalax galili TaxID=1026970 RepID=A0A8C6RG97_NANGA